MKLLLLCVEVQLSSNRRLEVTHTTASSSAATGGATTTSADYWAFFYLLLFFKFLLILLLLLLLLLQPSNFVLVCLLFLVLLVQKDVVVDVDVDDESVSGAEKTGRNTDRHTHPCCMEDVNSSDATVEERISKE